MLENDISFGTVKILSVKYLIIKVGISQQEILLNLGFMLVDIHQQGAPAILMEQLVISVGFTV